MSQNLKILLRASLEAALHNANLTCYTTQQKQKVKEIERQFNVAEDQNDFNKMEACLAQLSDFTS
jgi:hypothetical protein